MTRAFTREACLDALQLGADWLEGVAQERRPSMPAYGSLRADYTLRERRWRTAGPLWHTGQAGRAFLAAYRVTENPRYLKGAERAATYLSNQQMLDPSNSALHGLVNAPERRPGHVSVSAVLQSIRLFTDMADQTGERHWDDRFLMAMQWVLRSAYLLQGKVMESVSPKTGEAETQGVWGPNTPCARPLIDEACFHEAFVRSGEASFERAFRTMADRLLDDEGPPGHWAVYPPSDRRTGLLVSRQAFWWGRPLLVAGDAFGEERYFGAATRTGQWFMEYQNLDGGFYAQSWASGYHASFDLSSSAAACAALVWFDLYDHSHDETYLEAARDSLRFLLRMQFAGEVEDINVRGAFVESLDMPAAAAATNAETAEEGAGSPFFDGTDVLSVYVADIATTFAVQALARAIETPAIFGLEA